MGFRKLQPTSVERSPSTIARLIEMQCRDELLLTEVDEGTNKGKVSYDSLGSSDPNEPLCEANIIS